MSKDMTEKELLIKLCSLIEDLIKEFNKVVALQIVLVKSIQDSV